MKIAEVKELLAGEPTEQQLAELAQDERSGVQKLVASYYKRQEKLQAAKQKFYEMQAFERECYAAGQQLVAGVDEAGRGPLAGPLVIAAVILPQDVFINGLNDSKQVKPEDRKRIAAQVKECALAWTVVYIEPAAIDAAGMTASLVKAFRRAIAAVENAGVHPDVVLLDGNPLHMDAREVNVVKGDGKCASIAAASIVAKVERDDLMCRLAAEYPEYGFDANKGYASPAHIAAIKEHGLSPMHRVSFCTAFTQPTLF